MGRRHLIWLACTLILAALAVELTHEYHVGTDLRWRGLRTWGCGTAAASLFLLVALYSVRKRLTFVSFRYFKRQGDFITRLDAAQQGVLDVQRQVYNGLLQTPRAIRRAVRALLKAQRLGGFFAPELEPRATEGGGRTFEIKLVKRDPLGALSTWLQMHLYLGSLCLVLIVIHAGQGLGTGVSRYALLAFAATVLTGSLGFGIFMSLPRLQSRHELYETPADLAWQLALLRARLHELLAQSPPDLKEAAVATDPTGVGPRPPRGKGIESQRLKAQVDEGTLPRDVELLTRQKHALEAHLNRARLYHLLMEGWLVVHVPLAAAAVIFVCVHALSFWVF